MRWLAFLVTIAFCPLCMQGVIAPRWAVMSVGLGVLLFTLRKVHWTPAHALWLVFMSWASLTVLWTHYPYDFVSGLGVLALIGGLFLVTAETYDAAPLFEGLALGVAVNLGFVVLQLNDINWWGEFSPPGGLFSNKNMLAELAAFTLIGCLICRRYFVALPCVPVVWFCFSRASALALGAAFMVWLWGRSRLAAGAALIAGACIVPYAVRRYPASVLEREQIYRDTAAQWSWFGDGLGSFFQRYPEFASVQTLTMKPDHVHNDFLEIAYELGIVGLVLYVAFLTSILYKPTPYRPLLVAMVAVSCVTFPLHLPVSVFVFGCVAGLCAGHLYRRGGVVGDGRILALQGQSRQGWAGVLLGRARASVVASLSQGRGVLHDEADGCGLRQAEQPRGAARADRGPQDRSNVKRSAAAAVRRHKRLA